MSRKLKFKIISCSSEQQQYPVSSLLFSGSQGWQTRRFCTYPQQITLQFYGVVNIRKIQLVSDHRKISSQVDILYYVPVGHQEQRFYKYGYFQFNRNDVGNVRQVKTIMVDINCLYLRLLFHKPHPSKENFFSQIGIKALSLFGSDQADSLMQQPQPVEEGANQDELNQQDERYIEERVSRLTVQKQKAISEQDYETANYYKNTINLIYQVRSKLRDNRVKINKALQNQDYQTAKLIKVEIDKHKEEINMILQDKVQENQLQPELQENQFADIHKSQAQMGNQFMDPINLSNSRQSRQESKANSRVIHQQTQHQQNYDERIIPTLRAGKLKTEPDQQGEEKPKPPPPVEQVQGKYIKDATVMQEYFDQQTVKKFFSVHWQHNLDSLTSILSVLPTKHKDIGLMKCLITIVKYSSKQINFQVSVQSLNIFQQMLKMNGESQAITKPGDQQNDLDQIGKEIIKKLTDNNIKLKTASQRSFALMNGSLLFGVQACSMLLSKSKAKLASKQVATRLILLSKMIGDYGLGGANCVPVSALDFAIQNCNNPAEEVRKLAIGLLTTAYKKDATKTDPKLLGLKQSIQQQIRDGGLIITPQKNKKK